MHLFDFFKFVYPTRCPVCDALSPQGICDDCRGKLLFVGKDFCMKCGKPIDGEQKEYCWDCGRKKHAFIQGRSLLSYQGAIRGSLYQLKYGNRRDYGDVYGKELAKHLGPWIRQHRITTIVPIPLHPGRKKKRGYNQAAVIAKSLGRGLNLPVEEHLLGRKKKTSPQKNLSDRERKENIRGAFFLQKELYPGERILLVDDIYTTGSTMDEAAATLRREGPCKVYVLTVAIGG